jgi:hypothetical protein
VGTVLDQSNLTNYQFLPCLERAGLRRFRFHELRHYAESRNMPNDCAIAASLSLSALKSFGIV